MGNSTYKLPENVAPNTCKYQGLFLSVNTLTFKSINWIYASKNDNNAIMFPWNKANLFIQLCQ